jgi:glycosyltransferase involved in cell wall biosynthesis
MNSLVIPVYRNAESLPDLFTAISALAAASAEPFEAVFVVDGSPDDSHALLRAALPRLPFTTQLIELSRNFGAFAAIREGLRHARGDCFAVMAADLQEPPELVATFFAELRANTADVVVGTREGRADPWLDRTYSRTFWSVYKRFVQPEMPAGGIDVFGCNRAFRDHLLALESVATSLVGQIVWLGFRRKEIPYDRRAREHGKSAWSFRKKLSRSRRCSSAARSGSCCPFSSASRC